MLYRVLQPILVQGRYYGSPDAPDQVEILDTAFAARLQSEGLIDEAPQAVAPEQLEEPIEELPSEEPATEQPPSLLNVNTATNAELQSLDGIGRTTAAAIVANRPYSDLEALRSLSPRVDWDSVIPLLTLGGEL